MNAHEKDGGSSRLAGTLRATLNPATAGGDLRILTDALMAVSALLVVLALVLKPTGPGIAANLSWILAAVASVGLWVRLVWEVIKTFTGAGNDD